MEISFSKFYENETSTKPKFELSFPVMMDHDSGYVSHNPESNSDSSMENPTETLVNTCLRPIYLSEDALLEKPEIMLEKISKPNEDDIKDPRNIIDSPEIIPSSVVSQVTNYSGFDNESDLEVSIEIPMAKQIVLEAVGNCNGSISFLFSNIDELVDANKCNKTSNQVSTFISSNNEDNTVENSSTVLTTPITSDMSNKLGSENISQPNSPPKMAENDYLNTLNNITNTCIHPFNQNESNKKLTLIFSKCNKENVYSVKRKYRSLSPDDGEILENLDGDLNNSESLKATVLCSAQYDNAKSELNRDIDTAENKTENTFPIQKTNSDDHNIDEDISEVNEIHTTEDPNLKNNEHTSTSTVSLTRTPDKKYENVVDPNISPDLFDEEETVKKEKHEVEEKYITKRDLKILKRVQNNIKGVLPPFSMTVVQMSVNEMLNRLESNKDYYWSNWCPYNDAKDRSADTLNSSNESGIVGQPTSLLITGSLENSITRPWPNILEERYHGLHFNRSKVSEQFEELCVKYGQRYVGAETQSSCTVFETNYVSPVKRKLLKQRWPVKSPGRRLSHLAKRRITFSNSNLQAGTSSVASSRARQILVDARKLDLLNRRRSPKKSPRKTPRKSPRVKSRTPSSSAKKKLAMRFRALAGEIEKTSTSSSNQMLSSKRALFQSPDRDKNPSLFLPSTSGISTFKNDLKNSNTKRTLFVSPSKKSPVKKSPFKRSPLKFSELRVDKKRKRSEVDDVLNPSKTATMDIRPSQSEVKSKFSKSMINEMNMSLNRSFSMQSGELSTIHKKKLQWAVYEALRSQNIAPTHTQFKMFASVLARVTRRFLPNLNGTSRPEGSTSERMLRIARHHVFAVIKGKTVDEIFHDYIKNRSRNVKPQGYIGIEEFNEKNKENAVRGRVNTIESLEKKKLEHLGCENRIERIRKVINFGDDNR